MRCSRRRRSAGVRLECLAAGNFHRGFFFFVFFILLPFWEEAPAMGGSSWLLLLLLRVDTNLAFKLDIERIMWVETPTASSSNVSSLVRGGKQTTKRERKRMGDYMISLRYTCILFHADHARIIYSTARTTVGDARVYGNDTGYTI